MTDQLRQTGIGIVGDVPWGTHLCFFYETDEDLLQAVIPFLKAGLENEEFCVWVIPGRLTLADAWAALGKAIPRLEQYRLRGSIEILHDKGWYLSSATFNLEHVLSAWGKKLAGALARGYAGMRATGDASGSKPADWDEICQYEGAINGVIAQQPVIALCTYPLAGAGTPDVCIHQVPGFTLDVIRTHQLAMVRRNGACQAVETLQLHSVTERLRSLSRRLLETRETERRIIARELHDEVGQALTAVTLSLQNAKRMANRTQRGAVLDDGISILARLLQQVRDLSLDLRPSLLDDLGLAAAIRWQADRQAQRAGFKAEVVAEDTPTRLPAGLEIACYRIVQEALTNVARHARASHVRVELRRADSELQLLVLDDGVGFEPDAVSERGANLGLSGMQEWTSLLGGRLQVESAPNCGTIIRARFPLARK